MESEVETTQVTKLTLDKEEAVWLKALVQNPLCAPGSEDPQDNIMRQRFWDALINVSW